MKFTIVINQKAIIDQQLPLDLAEAAILSFCYEYSASPHARRMNDGPVMYVELSPGFISIQLPLLRMKSDTIYRRMKLLVDGGYLLSHPDNKSARSCWYSITALTAGLVFERGTDPSASAQSATLAGPLSRKATETGEESQTFSLSTTPTRPDRLGCTSDVSDVHPMQKADFGDRLGLQSDTSDVHPSPDPVHIGLQSDTSDVHPSHRTYIRVQTPDEQPDSDEHPTYRMKPGVSTPENSPKADGHGLGCTSDINTIKDSKSIVKKEAVVVVKYIAGEEENSMAEPAAAAADADADFLKKFFQVGEIPPFVAQHRQEINRGCDEVTEAWCSVKSLPTTRAELVNMIKLLFAGQKGELFLKKFKQPYTYFAESFIEQRAINQNFRDRSQIDTTFRYFAQDVLDGKRSIGITEAVAAARPGSPQSRNAPPVTDEERRRSTSRFVLPAHLRD